jgi:hypothetical protein
MQGALSSVVAPGILNKSTIQSLAAKEALNLADTAKERKTRVWSSACASVVSIINFWKAICSRSDMIYLQLAAHSRLASKITRGHV